MEAKVYIRILRRWFWLLLLCAILVGGLSFLIRTQQPAIYKANTTIAIGSFIQSPDPNVGEIQTGIQLAQTYVELVKTFNVLQATIDALNLPFSVDQLEDMVKARVINQTSLLNLEVSYSDPVLAARMADEIANQLIINSPSNLTPGQQNQIMTTNEQIDALVEEVNLLRLQLSAIDNQINSVQDPDQLAQLREARGELVNQINLAAATMAQFSGTIASLQQRTNSLDIVESARVPTKPSGINVWLIAFLGAFVGASATFFIVQLIELLDDTVKTPQETAEALGLRILATIPRFGKPKDQYPERLVSNLLPISPIWEAYRVLRANLLFATGESNNGVFVVTSPGSNDGKTVTTANLAVALAQAGSQVLLIDADLRCPRIHDLFGLNNEVGLTSLLAAAPSDSVAFPPHKQNLNSADLDILQQCIRRTEIPGLSVITSGFIPQNPTEILGSTLMRRWTKAFRAASKFDFILIDSPPTLAVADSAVLTRTVEASVILVLEAGKTHRSAALDVKTQFEHTGRDIVGIVLNGFNPRDRDYSDYSGYYTYYGQLIGDQTATNHQGITGLLAGIFNKSNDLGP